MANDDPTKNSNSMFNGTLSRRDFIKISAGTAVALSLGLYGCGTSDNNTLASQTVEPVFFVHISDSHFGGDTTLGESQDPTMLKVIPKELMSALVNDIIPVVVPLATIHTGDLVNEGYQLEPWQSYQDVFANTTMKYPENYIEIPGNHDAKVSITTVNGEDIGDGRELFVQHSVIGQALGNSGDKYGLTELSSPSGTVRLVRTNTSTSEKESLTARNEENINGYFTSAQQQALLNDLSNSQPAMFSVVLGHHPITGPTPIAIGNDLMTDLVTAADAPIYLCGHVHKPDIMWSGKTIVIQADTFGRHGEPSSFYLVAYDSGVIAAKLITIDATPPFNFGWPLVFITSPANSSLGNTDSDLGNVNDGTVQHPYNTSYTAGNPNATPFTPDATPTLRAMIFSPSTNPITSVNYSLDGGPFSHELKQTVGRLWEALLNLQGLQPGSHTVTVQAKSSDVQIGVDTISITVS